MPIQSAVLPALNQGQVMLLWPVPSLNMLDLNKLYPLPIEEDFPRAFCRMDPHPTGDILSQGFFSPTKHQGADHSLPDIHSSCWVICQCVFCTTKKEKTLLHTPSPSSESCYEERLCAHCVTVPAWAATQTHSWHHHHPSLRGKRALIALRSSSSFTSQSRLFLLGTGAQHWFNSPQFGSVCFLRPTTIILPKHGRQQRSRKKILHSNTALWSSPTALTSLFFICTFKPSSPSSWADVFVRWTFTAELHQWLSRFCGCKIQPKSGKKTPSSSHFCLGQSPKVLHIT